FDKSRGPLEQALAIDKDLALPTRILRDLMLLGRAEQGRGEGTRARAYFARARSVADAIPDAPASAEAERLGAALGK
ncbi:MAG: hypothetical protein JO035_06645, partial [Betaproteobacteria bacterium]|nr:hypothetical protein [Betaproteobacteria bacterium]